MHRQVTNLLPGRARTSTTASGRVQGGQLTRKALTLVGGVLLASGWMASCGGRQPQLQTENEGQVVDQPDPGLGSAFLIGDPHFGGEASNLQLRGVFWGRLANIADQSGDIQFEDFVISPSIRDQSVFVPTVGDPVTYTLERNAVTDDFRVTINAAAGTNRFKEAVLNLEADLTPVFDKSLEPSEVGPFSMVPRNAAMVLLFQDLLEPHFVNGSWRDSSAGGVVSATTGQLNKALVKVRTGYPPVDPYEARVFVDPNHGDVIDRNGDGTPEFYSTRVVIASTISSFDSLVSDPPLATNSTGLPPSQVVDDTNLALRIPTTLNASIGQTAILRNAGGKALSLSGNGSTDSSTGTADVVRALRSGGTVTNDADNGFLRDEDQPRVLGDLTVLISTTPVVDDPQRPERYRIPQFAFEVATCATSPKVGDVLTQPNGLSGIVVETGAQSGPVINNMVVDVIAPVGGAVIAGPAQLQTPFQPGIDNPPCFVRFSPNPGTAPNEDVDVNAQVVLRFSEPMDPETLKSFDGFTVTRVSSDPTAFDYAIGQVVAAPDLRSFAWSHEPVPFSHVQGQEETYFVTLASGAEGPTDLAGNQLLFSLPQTDFSLAAGQQTGENAGFALRFDGADELYDDGFPELRLGQILYDVANERILPRPVNRFDVAADRNQPLVSVMTPFTAGVQTPLSNLGSKLQTVWRYCDLGFSHNDESNMNIDVEGLSWAPIGGTIVSDAYTEFSIRLAHSTWLPDEVLDPNSGFPAWPASGLKQIYSNNYLDPVNDPGAIVHPRELGYVVNPADLYQASSGTPMLPFPMNGDVPVEQYRYYTWRDTTITAVGGASGGGVPLDQEIAILGLAPNKDYPVGNVPTAALPLLMEFRCYPSEEALGLNAFDISLAANSSARPNFRAFSTGGFDGSQLQTVNPDNSDSASGGYNPGSTPPGQATPGTDNSFYIGEMAIVTRVSRVHTIWFDTAFNTPTYAQPLVEPAPQDQPAGTQIQFAYRGAVNVTGAGTTGILNNSATLDVYGDPETGNGTPQYLFNDSSWKNDITQINSARFFQVRMSFISNTATERTAELRSLGFAYFNN
jgi:hypothetical protein